MLPWAERGVGWPVGRSRGDVSRRCAASGRGSARFVLKRIPYSFYYEYTLPLTAPLYYFSRLRSFLENEESCAAARCGWATGRLRTSAPPSQLRPPPNSSASSKAIPSSSRRRESSNVACLVVKVRVRG